MNLQEEVTQELPSIQARSKYQIPQKVNSQNIVTGG